MLILQDCIQKLPKRRNLCLTINSPYTTDSKIFNIDEHIIVSVINDDLAPLKTVIEDLLRCTKVSKTHYFQ